MNHRQQYRPHPDPDSERRTITVVQAAVHRTETLPGLDEGEEWALKMSQLLRTAGAEIHRYGGDVDHYDASGLTAFFGAQTTHEDDPERGVLAALAMQKIFNAQLVQLHHALMEAPGHSTGIDMQIAVHTGDAIITVMDDDRGTRQRAVIGDSIMATSRLLAETNVGDIQVSEATYRLVASLFEWEFQDMQNSYIPITHLSEGDKRRDITGIRSILVGRDREFHILHEAVDQLKSGIGGIVTLIGEAGIGKSRLAAEVRKSTDLKWVEGRCLSYSGTMAYALWQSILRALLEITVDTPPAIIGYALRKQMHDFDYRSFYAELCLYWKASLDAFGYRVGSIGRPDGR